MTRLPILILAAFGPLTGAARLTAADLKTFDRTLRKEPAYAGTPRYALLVFGPDAQDRVWLVHDGDALYADRNGNGDLTDDGPPARPPMKKWTDPRPEFAVPELRAGGRVHKNLSVTADQLSRWPAFHPIGGHPAAKAALAKDPAAMTYALSLEVEHPTLRGDGVGGRIEQSAGFADRTGPLVFARTPADAPVLHFAGPLTLAPEEDFPLRLGRENDLRVNVVTPGVGTGSAVALHYHETIPTFSAAVAVAVTWPGAKPVKELFELKGWC